MVWKITDSNGQGHLAEGLTIEEALSAYDHWRSQQKHTTSSADRVDTPQWTDHAGPTGAGMTEDELNVIVVMGTDTERALANRLLKAYEAIRFLLESCADIEVNLRCIEDAISLKELQDMNLWELQRMVLPARVAAAKEILPEPASAVRWKDVTEPVSVLVHKIVHGHEHWDGVREMLKRKFAEDGAA